jgi:hypothetical protein
MLAVDQASLPKIPDSSRMMASRSSIPARRSCQVIR